MMNGLGPLCRWSTIMSVVNRSGKMSVHERIDIDPERTGKALSAQRYPGRSDPKIPADSCQPGPREFPAAYSLAIPRIAAPADGHRGPCAAMKTVRRPPYPKWNPGYFPCSSLTPLPLSSRRPSVSFGGFGLKEEHYGT